MMEIVRRDLERYLRHSAGDRRARVLAIATNCGLQAVLVYRFGRWLQRMPWWLFPLAVPGWLLLPGPELRSVRQTEGRGERT